jgi:hypothetical protein
VLQYENVTHLRLLIALLSGTVCSVAERAMSEAGQRNQKKKVVSVEISKHSKGKTGKN